MKGLLLKDIYMAVKYCRMYLIITAVFIALSFGNNENMFMLFYPCMMCGMIPVNLLAYDERSKWIVYSQTMPYTRKQIVCGKYLIGLGVQVVVLILTGVAQMIQMNLNGVFDPGQFFATMIVLFIASLVVSSATFPFIFKLGVEKGRMAYYVMIGLVCAGGAILSRMVSENSVQGINPSIFVLVFCIVGIGIYALSWYLSIVFYEKREI